MTVAAAATREGEGAIEAPAVTVTVREAPAVTVREARRQM